MSRARARRLSPFWLGAGLLLALFGTNEIVAYHLSRVPRWLGGPLAYGGAWIAVAVGVFVIWAYGVEDPPEDDQPPTARGAPPPREE